MARILAMLPNGTRHEWHSDREVDEFMRTQPDRFQRHYERLLRVEHRIDMWRYLYLHRRGGIYLDADNELSSPLGADLLHVVDSIFVYDSKFGNVHNGFFVTRPQNPVLWATAEMMVAMGASRANGFTLLRFHHNLRYLMFELLNLIEPYERTNGTRWGSLSTAQESTPTYRPTLPRCDSCRLSNGTRGAASHCLSDGSTLGRWDQSRPHLYYVDSCGWRTLVLTRRGCNGSADRPTTGAGYCGTDGVTPLISNVGGHH